MIWVILIVYLLLMIGIGIYCRKKTSSVDDFVLGGRSIGPWFTAFAYGTSYFSAVVFIGYAGQFGWSYGASSTWIGIGNALIGSLLAWIILGKRTRAMSKHLGASTMPEFFEKRYGSRSLKISSAIIIFIFLIPYTASVYNGLSRLFESAFHIPYTYCILIMAVFTAVYVILGGYFATAINDFIQGMIMLAGIIAVVGCCVAYKGGLSSAMAQLGEIELNGQTGILNSVGGPDPINLIGVVILTSLGTWGLPQMVSKFYAIKDDAAIKRGSIISTIFAVVVAGGSYFLGGFGRLYATEPEVNEAGKFVLNRLPNGKLEFDAIVPAMLNTALPDVLLGLVVVLVLSASMSTLSSLVLTSSSTITIDLIKPLAKDIDDKKQVRLMRVLIVVFLALSVILAMNKNAYITTLMSISWGALAGAFLAPFLWGLYSKSITKTACWFCFIWGVGITLIHTVLFSLGWFPGTVEAVKALGWKLNILSPLNCGAFTMISTLILCPLVSKITPISEKTQNSAASSFEYTAAE